VFRAEHGDRPGAANVVLLLSDGESDDPEMTFQRANELRETGVVIVVVGKWPASKQPLVSQLSDLTVG